jgi:hypothetical protein
MIEGKVAEIISTRELAINRGSDDGVREGMRFEVLDPAAIEIEDPDTGAKLGSIVTIKIRVRVTMAERKYAIAETYETVGGGLSLSSTGITAAFGKVRTLRTADLQLEPLSEEASYVKRGDPIREIVEQTASAATQGQITATTKPA